MQPLAEPWKIFLPVTQVLGKQAGEAGSEMRLQSEGLPGYQSPISGPFTEAPCTRRCMWPADHPGHAFAKCLGAAGVLIRQRYIPLHCTGAKQSKGEGLSKSLALR